VTFFFFLVGTRALTQGLTLARQLLFHLSHSISPFFVMGIFKIGSHKLFAQGLALNTVVLIFASWVARITGVSGWQNLSFKSILCVLFSGIKYIYNTAWLLSLFPETFPRLIKKLPRVVIPHCHLPWVLGNFSSTLSLWSTIIHYLSFCVWLLHSRFQGLSTL
jgi:hypothetical protein